MLFGRLRLKIIRKLIWPIGLPPSHLGHSSKLDGSRFVVGSKIVRTLFFENFLFQFFYNFERSDPESLAASCGRHKVQPAAAAASCGRHKVQPTISAASCGHHKVQPTISAASCGRHKVQSEPAAASCGRHKVRSAACGSIVWSPQTRFDALRQRCVVATYRQRPLPSSFRSSFLGSTYLYFSYYIPYIYMRVRGGG